MPDGPDTTDEFLDNAGDHTIPEHRRFEEEMAKLPEEVREKFRNVITTRPVMRPSETAKPTKTATAMQEPGITEFSRIKVGFAGAPGAKIEKSDTMVTGKYQRDHGIHINPKTITEAYPKK